jgi:hypothetical protein
MSIINPIPATPAPAPAPTTAQSQAKLVASVKSSSNILFRQMVKTFNNQFANIWSNADGLTPQQAFTAFGTNAADLCQLSNTLATAINAAAPNTVSTATPSPLVYNTDGTVTVGSVS